MSNLSRMMRTARAILDERDRKPAQPPFFVRTTWLFTELEELAQPGESAAFAAIKIARLGGDIGQCGRLVDQLHARSETLDPAIRHQRRQICGWIKDQSRREGK